MKIKLHGLIHVIILIITQIIIIIEKLQNKYHKTNFNKTGTLRTN